MESRTVSEFEKTWDKHRDLLKKGLATMGDVELITEVPAALKRLAKYIVRGFYELEYSFTIDVLIRYPCVKEDDMAILLKFDKKQLRTILTTLKSDKFIKSRMRVETGPNGKSTRHNYYYINYKVLVNVVKYKLDHIRRKIEADERDSTTRASFKCPACLSTFSDLEVNQLFDPLSEIFRCTYCSMEVEEDLSALPRRDVRTLLARFNEQIEPIFVLLRETENLVLASELLEPQPTEIPELAFSTDQRPGSPLMGIGSCAEKWADKSSSAGNMYVQNVDISVQESEVKKKGKEKMKEQPIWMKESSVQGTSLDAVDTCPAADVSTAFDENVNYNSSADNELIRTLLIHELKSASGPGMAPAPKCNQSDSESDTSESEEDKKQTKPAVVKVVSSKTEHEGEEQETLDPTVMVAGKCHCYSEVSQNPELVSFMTEEERNAYIQVGQQMFQSAYE
ncbi:general transcription factor IIE subunit 1-like isoform X2 [Rhinatrema bivittatum]|uniref:general transcription factor IIE subunit 1-like isoform X2 n=1 Tax=Rhinatrema bivittatum TaxID=194408 RepID=UPI00112A6CB9|nr:general transcription factor IIE subunit 1-like isoform X2 [Rhinatrema bivittatum]